jgi:hypothetical protein
VHTGTSSNIAFSASFPPLLLEFFIVGLMNQELEGDRRYKYHPADFMLH